MPRFPEAFHQPGLPFQKVIATKLLYNIYKTCYLKYYVLVHVALSTETRFMKGYRGTP